MRKFGRKLTSSLLALALLVSLLPIGAAPAQADTAGAFTVTKNEGSSDNAYTYSNGVLTVNDGAKLTISTNSQISDRIVISDNANVELTLAGVTIVAPYGELSDADSAIDVGDGAILSITLQAESSNTITGGSSQNNLAGPGIHVPDSASLVIQGSGGLSVTGGNSSSSYGGNGIGGKPVSGQAGGASGTVIILATGGITISGGAGMGTGSGVDIGGDQGSPDGDNGQGIRPDTNGTYTVYGDLKLPCDITIPQGATVTIPEGNSLTVPENVTLTNNGNITGEGSLKGDGTVTNNGDISVSDNDFMATVEVNVSTSPAAYNSSVTLTANVTNGDSSVSDGTVTFYRGKVNDSNKLNDEPANVTSGTATTSIQLTGNGWTPRESPYTITAVYTPAAGSSLIESSGSTQLTVTKAEQSAPNGTFLTTSSTENSIAVIFTDGTQTENENGIEIAYAEGLTADAPTSDWTTANKTASGTVYSATIGQLSPGTPYVFFARYKEGEYHKPSPPIVSDFVPYTKPKINTTSLPNAYVGVEYSQKLEAEAAEGIAVNWVIFSGSLPAGLTLSSDGIISGTPTAATSQAAAFSVTATIGEGTSSASSSRTFAINVLAGTPDISITSNSGTYTYGDTITISGSIAASTTPPASNGINAITEPAQNQVGLYLDDTQLATASVGDDGAFTLTYDTSDKGITPGETAQTLTVRYGGSSNLNSGTATVQITLKPKSIEAKFNGPLTKVYDGTTDAPTDLKLKLYDVLTGDDVSVTCNSITFDTAAVGNNRLITATGISLSGNDARYYVLSNTTATTSGSITGLEQDALTISGLPDKVYVGDQFTLTASGGTGEGVLTWQVVSGPAEIDASTGAVRVTGEGEIKICVTKAKDATHSATSAEITFTANEIPYTGKYSHEISTSVGDHGTISVDRYATEGDKVTITVLPDDAYKLDDLSVTAGGKDVELTDNGDGTFSFTMPSGDVKISATFAEDPDWTEPEEPSTDVSDLSIDVAPNAWYKAAVQYAYDNGLMTGVSNTEFAPEATTRAMIVSMLARLENVTSAESAGFADVDDNDWYATAVNWAANVGVVNGYEDGTFKPNTAITREQLAAILMNYASYKGEDVSNRADLSAYSDTATISSWANDVMQWAVAEGLISGMTADTLQPQGSATRAQVAAILERFLAQ